MKQSIVHITLVVRDYDEAIEFYTKLYSPMFKFSRDVRRVIYTTNAIESLNRAVFPASQALLKALYLATFELTKKWTMPLRNWGVVYAELSIMYSGRLTAA